MSNAGTGTAPHSLVIDQPGLARQINRLPMLPRAVIEALRILRDDAANADACADHITRDQALTARTLRLANSAFYGLPGRVGTIRHALDVLGRRTLGALVTTAAVATQVSPSNCPGFDFKACWRHALGAAIAAESLAIELGRDTGLAFSAGLLHDIGRLALVTFFPAQMGAVLAAARAQDLPQRQVERQQLGVDPTQVGGMIAAHWHFPPAVVTAIVDHHAAQPADLAAMVLRGRCRGARA